MKTRSEVAILCLSLTLCAAGCASGRLARLEEQTATLQEQTANVSQRLQGLERTREEVGRLDREAKAVADARLREFDVKLETLEEIVREIEERLAMVEDALQAGRVAPEAELQPEERELYDNAYIDFTRGEYGMALSGFQAFVERFPTSSLGDNAVYWMGECYAAQQKWEAALGQYRLLRDVYPDGDKVKSALLKEGLTLVELGRASEGETILRELLQRFPRSEEARVAREKLAGMG